jgi:RHS repeat-associated protein
MTDPTGTYQFTFDNMGRLTGTSTQYAFLTSRAFTTSYGYDAASNRTSFTDPENGASSYVYDTLNRLQTLTPPAAISSGNFGFGYDALSRRTSLTRPNTVNTSYGYDNLSRLLSVTHAKGGVMLDGATYTVDNAGNRTAKSDLYAGVTTNYGYDNIYELLSATQGGSTTESYTYDPVGNRLTALGSALWSYNTSNELNSRPGVSYAFDANSNTIVKTDSTGSTSYTWDFENRLTGVTLPGSGGSVSFKYDPFGRRIYKSSSSGTSIYVYDWDNLIEETNAVGSSVARYALTENLDEPLAMLRGGTTNYYEQDGIGTVTSLSNTAGSLAQTYMFDSFGNQTASSGSVTNPFQYTGREFDTETNLQFSRARYYDAKAGRFLSEDPIRFKAGINFYRYVENDPVSGNDPLGLKTCIWTGDVDLFTTTSSTNKRYGPWTSDNPFKEGGPSAGPFGLNNSPPPGVNRRGVPLGVMACRWHRDVVYDQTETTYFIKTFLCFDTEPCGETRIWPEFEFAKRTRFLGARKSGFPETSVQTYDWPLGEDFNPAKRCQSLGPPNQ